MGCECGMQVKVKQLGATSGAKEQQENSDIRLLHRYAYAVPSNVLQYSISRRMQCRVMCYSIGRRYSGACLFYPTGRDHMHPTPNVLCPILYTLRLTSHTLQPTHHTPHATQPVRCHKSTCNSINVGQSSIGIIAFLAHPSILGTHETQIPQTRSPRSETLNPKPEIWNPDPETRDSRPKTEKKLRRTRNPKPETSKLKQAKCLV
jgi:hypothetical protein